MGYEMSGGKYEMVKRRNCKGRRRIEWTGRKVI
jgi:hypothetical protein